jgi:excisionase family DNA binding protein
MSISGTYQHILADFWRSCQDDSFVTSSELMSLSEVAQYLGMAERTIYLWAQERKLPAFKLGSSWRFRRSEIDAWLETNRSGPDMSNELLTDPVEPPKTRRQVKQEEEAASEALIAACITYINTLMLDDDRDVWTVEQILEKFDQGTVEESIKRLRRQRKISVGDEAGLGREKVRVIRRRR